MLYTTPFLWFAGIGFLGCTSSVKWSWRDGWTVLARMANTLLMDSDHPLMYESDCDFCTQLKKAYVAAISYLIAWFCSVLLIKINSLCCTVAHRLWTCCTVTCFNCTACLKSHFMCPLQLDSTSWCMMNQRTFECHTLRRWTGQYTCHWTFIYTSVQNYKASCTVERSFVMHDAGCQEILYFIAI